MGKYLKLVTLSDLAVIVSFHFSVGSTTEVDDLESACSSFVGATVFEPVAVWTLLDQSACHHGGAQGFPLPRIRLYDSLAAEACVARVMHVCLHIC